MKARGHVFFDFTDVVIDCVFNLASAARRNHHQQAISRGAKSGILRNMFQLALQSCVSL